MPLWEGHWRTRSNTRAGREGRRTIPQSRAGTGGSSVPEDSELDLLAASMAAGLTREYAGDREMFLSLLVETLQPSLGERLRVERDGGWFRRNGSIRRL